MKSICCAIPLLFASLANAHDIEWRHTFHLTQSSSFDVPDRSGHVVSVGEGTGLGFFPEGEVATMKLTYSVDFIKSEGTFTAYETYRFPSGSTISVQRIGSTTVDPTTKVSTLSGNFKFVAGSGVYEGISGGGTFIGKRLNPLAAGADQYLDYKGSYEFTKK
ncbi:hypothetical protein [Ralstonia mannitolilytica]|uniref:hypothetical protein n=1 Tax=Ralstonia mannitolilytica TaxID=105219 RepID=UPI001425BB52|nr:hypothetical protein [Ralstonia mannitolilytica]CAJ0698157.1 hypothetical protein LMG18102_02653 [Ralstonia mannitolilytica]